MHKNAHRSAFYLVTLLFFLWGFITVLVDSLIPRIRELFTLSYFEAGLVQFAFFGAYFLLSIPASYILARIGYKNGILVGLVTMAMGCLLFYWAADVRLFSVFITGYFTLAAGMTFLQVAANPYVAALGSEAGASSRLNLSQAFNSLGTAIAPAVGAMFILSDNILSPEQIEKLDQVSRTTYLINEASAVQFPFMIIALIVVLIALIFFFIKLPHIIEADDMGSYGDALRHPQVLLGVLGIFFYVGAEVAIGSYLVNYFLDMNMVELIRESSFMTSLAEMLLNSGLDANDGKAIVGIFVTMYWSGAMIGRFIGSYLTKVINPRLVLMWFALGAILLISISMSTQGLVSMWSILGVGLFNSIMFPTIFVIAIEGIGELKPKASGLLVTAIVGGAIIPPIYGFFTDNFGFKPALLFIILCYAYILWYGYKTSRKSLNINAIQLIKS